MHGPGVENISPPPGAGACPCGEPANGNPCTPDQRCPYAKGMPSARWPCQCPPNKTCTCDDQIPLPPPSCRPFGGVAVCCVRGTVGCQESHTEPTLLERLDAAEEDLRKAERARTLAYQIAASLRPNAGSDRLVSKAETGSMVAAALCSAAAARALVCVEDLPE